MASRLFRSRQGGIRWWCAAVLLIALLPLVTGCYGKFPTTRTIYKFNGEVSENKTAQTLVMWAFVILPVYSIATLADAVVFNLVEFWTDETVETAGEMQPRGERLALRSLDPAPRPSQDGVGE